MSSDASDCKVLISGIRGLSEDDIVLFLESSRYCPKGGAVNHFVPITEDEAVVIFEDSQVANRLDEQLTLLDGTKISVEPYSEYQRRKSSQTASNTCQDSSEEENCLRNQRSKNRSETSRNENHESWGKKGSYKSSEHSDKWSGEAKSNVHVNETQFRPTYGISQSKGQERRSDSFSSTSTEASISSDSISSERSRAESKSYVSRTHGKHSGRRQSRSSSREGSRADSKSYGGRTGGKHSGRRQTRSSSEERSRTDSKSHGGKTGGKHSGRRKSRSSSGERSRPHSKSHGGKTGGKHSGRRKSRSSSGERSRPHSKSHGGKTGGKYSARRKSKSSSGERSRPDSQSHGGKTGGKHRGKRKSRSSSCDSNERQIRGSRPETSSANIDRCKKGHREASFEHSSKNEKPQKPPKPQKPTKPKTPPKPNSQITKTVETLPFACEKLKLMKLVWDLDLALRSSCNCNVRFDEQTHVVMLEGEVDDISKTKLLFLEMNIDFETQRLDVTPKIQKLLSTAKGDNWLTVDFRTLGIAALVFIKDATANLIAINKDTLISAANLIKQLVSTQNISFDDNHLCYLQSPSWPRKVQAIEVSGLISVHVNLSTKKIELCGRASEVDACATEIRELLKKNQTKTSIIKHTIGVVRLLKKQESSINKDIHHGVSSSIQLEFGCQEKIVKVIGLLDDVSKAENIIRNKYMKTIRYGTHEICTPGLTKEMFQASHGKQRDMIDLIENKHNCVVEVRGGGRGGGGGGGQREGGGGGGGGGGGHRASGGSRQQAESQSKSPSMGIEVTSGSIVQFKADVLVNTVADEGLEKGGVVLKQFLDAGAPKLQQDLQKLGIPQIFGSDVVATDAYGKLKAKFIFHAAIRKYQNQDSIEKLHNLIKKCLEMAAKRKVSTIAFPALGSGRLAFTPKDVVECFVRAKQTTKTTIKIFIVAVDDHTHREFKSHLSNALSETAEGEARDNSHQHGGIKDWLKDLFSGDKGQEEPSSASEASSSAPAKNKIVFHINTTNEKDLQFVKEDLVKRIDDMVDAFTIKDDLLTVLDDNTIANIRALQTPEVAIALDRRNGVIKMKGDRLKVLEIKGLITAIIVSLRDVDRYPKYWTNYKFTDNAASKVGVKRVKIDHRNSWHAEVSHLVMTSWEQQKVGLGRDANGLGVHSIKIRNVHCIENPTLLEKYMAKRKQLSKEASLKKFSPVNGLRNEQELATMNLGLRHLYGTLDGAVNEVFLLHGTKKETTGLINSDGLDTRICGDETLFGVGSYFAESSTKADQYTDPVDNRVALGHPLYMYVCRVLLGKPYVCDDPQNVYNFKRPPCQQRNCHKDKCSHPSAGRFDSIIGTHRPNPQQNGRLYFREFVVFHPDQSYPDFLVEYERVKYP